VTNAVPPDGARSNGLPATIWSLIATATPPIADNLLVALREGGIAAFSLPETGDSIYRGLSLDSPLGQKIYVDQSKRKLALEIVASEQSEWPESTNISDFEAIVSQLSMPSGTTYLDELDRLDHFEPPEPEPLPRFQKSTRIALLGALGGPLLLAANALTQFDPTGFATWLGLFGFVAGLAALLLQTRNPDEDDDDPESGAVV